MLGLLRAFACVVAVLLLAAPAEAAGRKVAMIVGNAAYQNAPALSNTVNDARAVAHSFERLGFTVLTAFDASQPDLIRTLAEFSTQLKDAEAGVFYYAGHGIQVGNENFILPVDIKVENELSIRYGALSLTDVLADLERLPKVAIVILDACRDNPFAAQLDQEEGRSLGQSRGLAPVALKGDGTLIAYAAAPGAVASDGAGEHSPYTAALLAELEQPGVEAALMFRRVAGRVIEATAGRQRPEILVRLVSEYYLAGVATPVVVEAVVPAAPATPAVAAPVDVAPVVQMAEDRQTTSRRDGRAALWGYDATLLESPLDLPRDAWAPPAGQAVAEAEPNSSFGSAQDVSPNDTVRLSIEAAGDNDWLRFTIGQAGRLTVTAATPPASITLDVRLVNANGDELVYWTPAPRPGGALDVDLDLPRPGVYALQFADADTSASALDSFDVALHFEPAADLYEPDDRVDLARHLPLDGTVPVAMFPKGDVDWFKFVAPQPGSLVVNLGSAPADIDTTFRVSNADGGELLYWQPAPRPGGDNLAVVDLPRPGVYYLQVADNGGDGSDPAPLMLTTRFAPSPDAYEPNDSFGSAMPVPTDGDNIVAIFPKGDSDFLEVEFAQPGELTLEAKTPPQNLSLTWRMLDSSGNEVQYWQPAARPGGDLYGTYDVGKPGRYFVQLADNASAASVEPANLHLGLRASLDAFEPNDSLGSAKPLTPGGEVQLTMLPRGDNDWFRVTVDQPGELAVSIDEQPENLALSFRVVAPDWTELLYWVPAYRKGGLTEGFADLPRAGTYYLQIADADTGQRSIEPATLKTVFTPTLNSNEPNNSFGEATPVEISGETEAQILPRYDTDWHVFQAPGPGQLDVEVTGVPENLEVAFHVLNADKTEIQYWVVPPRKGGDTVGTVTIPAAGWYWMELADSGNDDRSVKSFKVTRTFRAAQ